MRPLQILRIIMLNSRDYSVTGRDSSVKVVECAQRGGLHKRKGEKVEGWLRGTQSVLCICIYRHVQFELKIQQIMDDIEH